ncbi:MAG: ATP phosphoribosyltransferase [Clostridiales bacterium]|jgi:ATP phosphoribosyltransferase|nr:ATP phosphoribosyltransferase [Clostridiales bacterium]
MNHLTLALAKGRLAIQTMELFESIGITCQEMKSKSRKLIFESEERKYRFFLSKASDVPTYVEYGAADIGVAGADTLSEENRSLYEALDLGFGKCKMVVAGLPTSLERLNRGNDIRVTTKYPNIASRYFYQKRRQTVEIIKLNGSVELGAIVGLSDVIVDLVETGDTLKANGLVVLDEICDISARLVVNRVSMKMKYEQVIDLIKRLEERIYDKSI